MGCLIGSEVYKVAGISSWNGGWLRVVEFLCVCLGSGVFMSNIYVRSSMRAL